MVKRRLLTLLKSRSGASLAEFAIMLPVLLLLTFGAIETGFLMWQIQQGELAAKRAVRLASTRALLTPGAIGDCGPATPANGVAGQACSVLVPNDSSLWLQCRGNGTGGAGCGPEIGVLVAEIQRFYPRAAAANIVIQFHGGGLGFKGLGHPVPVITVKFENVQYQYLFLGGLAGLEDFTLPGMSASAAAEDLRNG